LALPRRARNSAGRGLRVPPRAEPRHRGASSTSTKRRFEGRVALVTGASGGIGGQSALALADEGADVALAHGAHVEDAEAIAGAFFAQELAPTRPKR
jgi:hypothetical protein